MAVIKNGKAGPILCGAILKPVISKRFPGIPKYLIY